MPVSHDPRLIVERQVPCSQNGDRASRDCRRRIDREELGVGKRAAQEGAMQHPIEANIIDEAGAPTQKASVLLAPYHLSLPVARMSLHPKKREAFFGDPRAALMRATGAQSPQMVARMSKAISGARFRA
jgi:hypothetical protein